MVPTVLIFIKNQHFFFPHECKTLNVFRLSHRITFTIHGSCAIFTGMERLCMEKEKGPVRCPACGSLLTGPSSSPCIWECRYYLCRAVFPVKKCPGSQECLDMWRDKPE
jgi:hypothetical protein